MLKIFLNYLISHRLQLIKFIIVGLTTSGIYFACFHLFFAVIQFDYRIASSIAYAITICSHFLLHRKFTFVAVEQNLAMNGWKYLSMLALNYAIMLAVMWFSVSILGCSPYLGLIFSTAITAGISFFMMKYFVFSLNVNVFQG